MYLCVSIQHLSEHVNVHYNKNQRNYQFESGNVEGVGEKKKRGECCNYTLIINIRKLNHLPTFSHMLFLLGEFFN